MNKAQLIFLAVFAGTFFGALFIIFASVGAM